MPLDRISRCPVCGGTPTPLLTADGVPVFCNVLLATREEARRAAVADIELAVCRACGHVWNTAFRPDLVEYAPGYENSLHVSPTFADFSATLAKRLVEDHRLHGKVALELGAGDGAFLHDLVAAGMARGIGFDPSFVPRATGPATDVVEIRAEPFPDTGVPGVDLVCARHVLEHLAEPGALATAAARTLTARPGAVAYVEVPDGRYMLEAPAVWDLIYEHPSYFTAESLQRLLRDAGLTVTRFGRAFCDQYLWAEARSSHPAAAAGPHDGVDAVVDAAMSFGVSVDRAVAEADAVVTAAMQRGPVALWGAGSKGVMFCARVPAARDLRWVVDINPRKHGRFVPVAGLEVVGPDALAVDPPATVVVMNPVYGGEVRSMLSTRGIDADVISV